MEVDDREAPARLLRVASLWDFAGNVWFFGSEADVEMLWRASLWDHLWQGNSRAGGEPSGELPAPLEL